MNKSEQNRFDELADGGLAGLGLQVLPALGFVANVGGGSWLICFPVLLRCHCCPHQTAL